MISFFSPITNNHFVSPSYKWPILRDLLNCQVWHHFRAVTEQPRFSNIRKSFAISLQTPDPPHFLISLLNPHQSSTIIDMNDHSDLLVPHRLIKIHKAFSLDHKHHIHSTSVLPKALLNQLPVLAIPDSQNSVISWRNRIILISLKVQHHAAVRCYHSLHL